MSVFLSIVALSCLGELAPQTTSSSSVATSTHTRSSTIVEPVEWPLFGFTRTGTPSFDIPINRSRRVEKWINHFQYRGKKRFRRWMARASKMAPLYYEILRKAELPLDTLFLSMIESGFYSRALSWASAAGLWQFMPRTGVRFGLEYSPWLDERLNKAKATQAAAAYLKYLYKYFGDWHLAWAAYNAGEARIRRGLRRSRTSDFWSLSETRHIPRETREYVPKLIAAAIVSKAPHRFGIEPPDYLDAETFETVTVTTAVSLKVIAEACGEDIELSEIQELNPELYRGITPPGRHYEVKVPRYWARDCESRLAEVPISERWTYRFHRNKDSRSIDDVAKKYQTTAQAILAHNKITKGQFSKFEAMVIPIPLIKDRDVPVEKLRMPLTRMGLYTPDSPPVRIHRVRRGDSLWKIARRYRVSLKKLKRWNGIYKTRYLRIGERIVIRGRSR
ncbi:MAG: transglycosylase SLT domain-containing protein [Myxococcota bacterium]|nr:transglycosylase SLT domain-containing protein [Myxococcota bacterium]